jgi:transposase-like protein
VTTKPSREAFSAAYLDRNVKVQELCLQYQVSDTTIKAWARRFGLAPRPAGGYRTPSNAPRIILKAEENHCEPVNDGPELGDPTPEEIAELAAYWRARNVLAMQTMEDQHCEHRRNGRCLKCQKRSA